MVENWQVYPNVGLAEIDDEHRALSGTLCELLASISREDTKQARIIIQALLQGVTDHFNHEEQLMMKTRYPRILRHQAAHQLFVQDASKQARDLMEFGMTPEFQRWALGHLAEWFHFHILSHDVPLGTFLLALNNPRSTTPPPTASTRVPH